MRNFKRGKDLSPMNKLKELREQKLDNKGFSLVELIIVIAIMAVLIGVLAPQYLKYVEKSRISTDKDNVTGIISALQIWGADPDATTTFAGGETVTLDNADHAQSAGSVVGDALISAGINTVPKLANKQTFDKVVITVNVGANGTVNVTPVYTKGGTVVTP